ncbi:ribose-5-phosphate isomerase RpiA [Pricia sp. S334]|uniref:Ribose-5-phosphate isomerase A n=1 Tax=Pricia mediterranea TaxID=3076079 RepID=A0ABU3LA13_9FLAO|nr:ribose-5-phosphate isomerase RpiA [Pricia sp. S334]MDT7830512.1 ribose-5-phosphate isomerase RpiA [Pricia sp. S334]
MDADIEKKAAAAKSLDWIRDGMLVGLGSGSTAAHMIRELGKKVADGGLTIKAVPSSDETAELAQNAGIQLLTLEEAGTLDVNIDGADEFDAKLQLIKGGGGAHLREKIVAHNSKFNIVIADSGKQVERLGKFKLPLETIPFATKNIMTELDGMGLSPVLRKKGDDVYRTDEQNYIVDIDVFEQNDLVALNHRLIQIPGVVETGLFLDTTDVIIMGKGEDTVIFEK